MSKIISIFLILLLSPLYIFVALLILFDDGFPIFLNKKEWVKVMNFFNN